MAIDKLLSNIEVLIEAPGGIDRLREYVLELATSGRLLSVTGSFQTLDLNWDYESLRLDKDRIWGLDWLTDSPSHWVKVPLARLGNWGSGGTPKRGNAGYYGGGIPWLVIGDLNDGEVTSSANTISQKGLEESSAVLIPVGSVLIAMYGSIGKAGIAGIQCATNQAIAHCTPDQNVVSTEYLLLLVRALKRKLFAMGRGLAQQNISQTLLKHLMVSLPPLEEQQQITRLAAELLALCDQLEEHKNERDSIRTAVRESAINAISTAQTPEELDAAWKRINNNWEVIADTPESVESLRRLVLRLAVCGELTPQIPGDGNSEHLAAEFEANQRKMVREEIISNPRFQRGLTIKEVPYEIPDSWRWYYLGEVGAVVGGGTPSTSVSSYWSNGESIPWLTPADMRKQTSRYISRGTRDITEKGLAESSAQLLPLGTVLFSSRAPIGHVGIAAQPLATNQGFKSCIPYVSEMSEYIFVFLLHIGPEIDAQATGTTFKEVSGKQVSQILIPVPPLAEQKRIVSKVDEIMALCDQLEAELKVRSEIAEKFARSILEVA